MTYRNAFLLFTLDDDVERGDFLETVACIVPYKMSESVSPSLFDKSSIANGFVPATYSTWRKPAGQTLTRQAC